ncbi:putative bacteriophage protein [Salmonella enterica subsp. enterica]|uniref:Putative bacteriophage protein n=1 Tax=Salmonella enterica I TaxID=59201 RepID=A0A379W9W0_SALET|nr:putative bacteriophage protein [Salmonella enterica subsp. enterica]
MANLRKEARGRECQVRIYGVCNGNPETTVLAHYRMAGICGTGMKPDDLIGAWLVARVTMKSTDAPIISTTKTPDFTTSKA